MSDYYNFDVSKFRQLHPTKLLLDWELANDDLLGGKLKRPETFKGIHYTGHIIMKGCDVTEPVEVGDRVLFEGYLNSDMPKFIDPKRGRCCIIDETEAIAVVPERVKISSIEGDFDYSS